MPTPDEFTGERFLPQCSGEIWAEHWHRYLFAAAHVAGRDVLDAACGEGYGAALLAQRARSVTGLDIDGPTIAAARAKYAMPALRFETGSVTAMPFADASFDCVVSFETLEHLAEQEAMLAEMRRVLRPHGVLIISTPNRVEYSDKRNFHNEYHVKELSEDEFRALLGRHFGAQRWYGQRLVFNSALWQLPAADGVPTDTGAGWVTVDAADRTLPAPMYFVALVAANPALLPAVARTTLLADPDDTMYRDYMQTVTREATLEQLVGERDRQLSAQHDRMQRFEALVGEREARIVERDRQLATLAARAATMERLIAEREQLIVERDEQIAAVNQARIERERLIAERDNQLAALNARIRTAEGHIAERERLVVERDAQLNAAAGRATVLEGLVAERERIIVERDAQLAAVNARAASLEELVAERERIIVERDGQLAAMDRRIADANALIVERDGRLLELGRTIESAETEIALRGRRLAERAAEVAALEDANRALREEVARRAGWRWWLVLPFLKIRRALSPAADAPQHGRP